MRQIGMEEIRKDIHNLACRFRQEVVRLGFLVPEYPLSNALTPIAADPHAERLYQKLKEEYGMIVTPSGGELRKILVRVGHLGNVKWDDYEELLTAIDQVKHGF